MVDLGRALRHRNFQLFFVGQGISLMGSQLNRFAAVWMVYRMTHSGLWLGLVAFLGQAPSSVIAPFAGVLVDRWDRRRVIIATQVAAMLQSAALAVFALTGVMTVWHLMILSTVQAVINAFDVPARQAFIGHMVDDRADLPNAIALNSMLFNGTRMIGPMCAAGLVEWFGEGSCFAIDAFSYLAVIASLLAITVSIQPPPPVRRHVWTELAAGWRYMVEQPLVRAVMLLISISSVLGGSYGTLLPLVARRTQGLGILMAAAGVGAFAGGLYLASRRTVIGLDTVIGRSVIGLGISMIALRFAPGPWSTTPIVFVIGACLMIQMGSTNTIIQTVVNPDYLGRVMSLYIMAFFGAASLGAVGVGLLADHIGALDTFSCAGLGTIIPGLVFMRALPRIRVAQSQRAR